jgi:hypothetical protein
MDFKKHLEIAWNYSLKYLVPLVLMTLVMFAVSALSLGILAAVTMAGYMQSIIDMLRSGREPKIKDLFSRMHLFLPLLVFSVLVALVVFVGFTLLVVPGFLLMLAIGFTCLYMLPLMTDQDLGIVAAIKKSYAMAFSENLAENGVVAILYFAFVFIGGSVFIGALFLQPFATVFLMSVYEEKVGAAVGTSMHKSDVAG